MRLTCTQYLGLVSSHFLAAFGNSIDVAVARPPLIIIKYSLVPSLGTRLNKVLQSKKFKKTWFLDAYTAWRIAQPFTPKAPPLRILMGQYRSKFSDHHVCTFQIKCSASWKAVPTEQENEKLCDYFKEKLSV